MKARNDEKTIELDVCTLDVFSFFFVYGLIFILRISLFFCACTVRAL